MASMCRFVMLALLLAPSCALKSEANMQVDSEKNKKSNLESGVKVKLTFDAVDAKKNRPIRKVIDLLKDMKKAIKEETEKDEEDYDKMSCWCDLTEKRLMKQIIDSEDAVKDYIAEIELLVALIAQLKVEIKNLLIDIDKWQKAIDEAHELRQKQKTEFHDEEKDLMESVGALRAAVIVLEKHHGGSLSQIPTQSMNAIKAAMKRSMDRHGSLLKNVLTHSAREAVSSLIQIGGTNLRTHTQNPSYQTASGQIFGILEQMLETFSSNLKAAQDEDAANEQAYQDLRDAKEKQIEEATASVKTKREQLYAARMRLEELQSLKPRTKEDTKKDEAFLREMRERCAIMEREYPVRQKTRALELKAVSETITMLSSEDAHELFSRTYNPSFLQILKKKKSTKVSKASKAQMQKRSQASKLLAKIAAKSHDPRVAMLAVTARLDSFKRVKESIDVMIAALMKQKVQETKVLENCKLLLKANEETTAAKTHTKGELADKISETEAAIKEMVDTIAANKKEIADLQAALKEAAAQRAEENTAYKQVIMDQTATQELLKKAVEVLKEFYDKDLTPAIPVLAQGSAEPVKRAMPEDFDFNVYEKQTETTASGGVIKMIQDIIYDSEQVVKDAKREEANAVKVFEELTKDTNDSIAAKEGLIAECESNKAEYLVTLQEAKQAMEDTMLEIDQLTNEATHINNECGFIMNNYEIRQKGIDDEAEALKQTKAILSGADFRETDA